MDARQLNWLAAVPEVPWNSEFTRLLVEALPHDQFALIVQAHPGERRELAQYFPEQMTIFYTHSMLEEQLTLLEGWGTAAAVEAATFREQMAQVIPSPENLEYNNVVKRTGEAFDGWQKVRKHNAEVRLLDEKFYCIQFLSEHIENNTNNTELFLHLKAIYPALVSNRPVSNIGETCHTFELSANQIMQYLEHSVLDPNARYFEIKYIGLWRSHGAILRKRARRLPIVTKEMFSLRKEFDAVYPDIMTNPNNLSWKQRCESLIILCDREIGRAHV